MHRTLHETDAQCIKQVRMRNDALFANSPLLLAMTDSEEGGRTEEPLLTHVDWHLPERVCEVEDERTEFVGWCVRAEGK